MSVAAGQGEARLRPAAPHDLDRLAPHVADFHRAEKLATTETGRREALRRLLSEPALGLVLLAERQGQVVGYGVLCAGFSIEFGGRDAFVDELYVVASRRGGGLGSRLLEGLEQAAREQGIVALHLEADHGNPRAQALYRRTGYADHDRHLMTKRLA